MSSTIPLIAFIVFAVADWIAVARDDRPLEYLTKPAALAALIVYAALGSLGSTWLITALTLSLLGDVYLMLPTDAFTVGLGAFLLAHVAYVIAFPTPLVRRLILLLIVIIVTSPFVMRISGAVRGTGLRAGVIVYMLTLAVMAASAFASGSRIAALAAALFVASDTILGWNRFVRPLSWARPAIMVTYHLGQLGLAYALRG